MERRRFTTDEETNYSETNNGIRSCGSGDNNKHLAVRGYKKLLAIILIFTGFMLFRNYIFDGVNVVGKSMEDSFQQGDVLIVEKYNTSNIQRYDVVIAKVKMQNMIKRVIGLPGETVQIKDNSVYVDGEKLKEQFDFYTEESGIADKPFVLGKDEYFLMGDNRSESLDSREYGAIKLENIKGIVIYRCYPFDKMGRISCRKDKSESE